MEKKTSCLLCVLTALLLAVLYLWAALRPGVWLRDARGELFHASETGHSIARPIACGNRVPPQRTLA